MMAVDDFGGRFVLTSQSEPAVDPERVIDLLVTVLERLTDELLDDRPAPAGAVVPTCDDLLLKLSLVRPAERQQVTYEFNATSQQIDFIPAIVQFERQAARVPAACAIQFEGDSLSYSALNLRANRFAHRLRSVGVRRGVLVAVGLERSLDLVVALLGIHKAGGAYVPLIRRFRKSACVSCSPTVRQRSS